MSNAENKKRNSKAEKMQILRETLTCKKVKTPQDDVDNSSNAKRANLKLLSDKELSNDHEKEWKKLQ